MPIRAHGIPSHTHWQSTKHRPVGQTAAGKRRRRKGTRKAAACARESKRFEYEMKSIAIHVAGRPQALVGHAKSTGSSSDCLPKKALVPTLRLEELASTALLRLGANPPSVASKRVQASANAEERLWSSGNTSVHAAQYAGGAVRTAERQPTDASHLLRWRVRLCTQAGRRLGRGASCRRTSARSSCNTGTGATARTPTVDGRLHSAFPWPPTSARKRRGDSVGSELGVPSFAPRCLADGPTLLADLLVHRPPALVQCCGTCFALYLYVFT